MLGLAFTCQLAPASAQDKEQTEQELRVIEAALAKKQRAKEALDQKTRVAESEAEEISQRLIRAAKTIRLAEENANRLELRIGELEKEVHTKNTNLSGRQDELLELLSALERLSKRPAALALLQPNEALTTARSASLMGTIVPTISAKAESLKTELNTLASIQADLSRQRYSLKNTLEGLTEHQLKLASLLEKRKQEASTARARARSAEQAVKQFAREAQDLRELLEKLTTAANTVASTRNRARLPARSVRPNSRPITELKGTLPQPAIGTIISRFGDKEAVGRAKGMKIRTRANAQVVAPYDGQIVFAGPFRDYGQLLIIEHGNDYFSLMSGFGDLHGAVGQWVLTGEPIGMMTASNEARELYIEMRRNGKAINPEPWLQKQVTQAR